MILFVMTQLVRKNVSTRIRSLELLVVLSSREYMMAAVAKIPRKNSSALCVPRRRIRGGLSKHIGEMHAGQDLLHRDLQTNEIEGGRC